ncbi:MAG: hypothetical protein AB7N76_06225 [Planctomycetota bacterium]
MSASRRSWLGLGAVGALLLLAATSAGAFLAIARAKVRASQAAAEAEDRDHAARDQLQARLLCEGALDAGLLALQAELVAGRAPAPPWFVDIYLDGSSSRADDTARVELRALQGTRATLRVEGRIELPRRKRSVEWVRHALEAEVEVGPGAPRILSRRDVE